MIHTDLATIPTEVKNDWEKGEIEKIKTNFVYWSNSKQMVMATKYQKNDEKEKGTFIESNTRARKRDKRN